MKCLQFNLGIYQILIYCFTSKVAMSLACADTVDCNVVNLPSSVDTDVYIQKIY